MTAQNAALKRAPAPAGAELEARLREFISTNFYVSDPADLEPDVPLVERGIVDSTGILEVISFIEAELGVRIRDDEMTPENLGSIRRIAGFLGQKLAEQA